MKNVRFVEVRSPEKIKKTVSLARDIWRENYTPIIGSEQVEYMLEKFQSFSAVSEQLKEGYKYYLLKKAEGDNAGYIAFIPREEVLFLSKLYIKRSERRKGYASDAVSFMEKAALKHGLLKIRLTVNRYNKKAIIFYSKTGFRKTSDKVTDIGCGFVMDDHVMEKQVKKRK
jgi:RimJ/RimL family protein N-acetyltransferase